jgi:hypothetical protein
MKILLKGSSFKSAEVVKEATYKDCRKRPTESLPAVVQLLVGMCDSRRLLL